MKKIISILLLIPCFSFIAFNQNQHLIDSLTLELKNHRQDTLAANILYDISWEYLGSDPHKAMDYAQQVLELSEKIKYKTGMSNAYNVMGAISLNKGDYLESLDLNKKILQLRQETGNKQKIAGTISNIGNIYNYLGNYPEALNNYLAALKIIEDTGNTSVMANVYTGIGDIYLKQSNFSGALDYYTKSLKIQEAIGDKGGIAGMYINIGTVKDDQGNLKEAMKNYLLALKIEEEIGDKLTVGNCHINIGVVYAKEGKYSEALDNYFVALKMHELLGEKTRMAMSCTNIGTAYTKLKNYPKAEEYLNTALELSKEIKNMEGIKYGYEGLFLLNSARGNYKQALEDFKSFIRYKDSLVNKENSKKMVQSQMQYEFDKKEAATKSDQEKKDLRQRNVRNSITAGLAGSLVFLLVVYRQRNKIRKEKERSDELLLNILPAEVAEELKSKGSADAQLIDQVTVLFTDFKGFTQLSEILTPKQLVAEINECFSAFDYIMLKYGIEKIKTIGDAYMAAGGLPTPNRTHATDVVQAALEIQEFMNQHRIKKENAGSLFFEIRIGINTGSVVAGIVGVKKFAYDIWGDTVNTASRMESSGEIGKVNISGSTYELIKDEFNCTPRGKISAKGKGDVEMYFVEGRV